MSSFRDLTREGTYVAIPARRRGFTLIEVLIVVVIMAILAAVLITQMTDSTDDARQASVDYSLRMMAGQIELYRLDHNVYPTITSNSLPQLLRYTDKAGNMSVTADPSYPYNPYILDDFPENPFTGKNTVAAPATNPPTAADVDATNGGWLYDDSTGQVWAGHALP